MNHLLYLLLLLYLLSKPVIIMFTFNYLFQVPGINYKVNLQGITTSLVILFSTIYLFLSPKSRTIAPIRFLLLLICVSLICVLRNIDSPFSIPSFIKLLGWSILILVLYKIISTQKRVKQVIKIGVYSFLTMTMGIVIYPLVTGRMAQYTPENYVGELTGLYFSRGEVGYSLYFFLPYLLYKFQETRRIRYLGLMICDIILVFFTFARTSWVMTIVFLIVILGCSTRGVKHRMLLTILGAGIIFLLLMESPIWDQIGSIAVKRFHDLRTGRVMSFGSGRVITWILVIQDFVRSSLINKIFGHGFGKDVKYLLTEGSFYGIRGYGVHSDYLKALYNTGLIGLGALIGFYITTLQLLWRYRYSLDPQVRDISSIAFATTIGLAVGSFLSGPIFGGIARMTIYAFFIGTVFGISHRVEDVYKRGGKTQ